MSVATEPDKLSGTQVVCLPCSACWGCVARRECIECARYCGTVCCPDAVIARDLGKNETPHCFSNSFCVINAYACCFCFCNPHAHQGQMLEAVGEPHATDDVCTMCFKGRCAAPLYWYYKEHRMVKGGKGDKEPLGVASSLMDRGTSCDLIQA
jgi:hypothetical protein